MTKKRAALLILVIVFIASAARGGYDKAKDLKKYSSGDLYRQVEIFSDALSIIKTEYVDDIEPKKLMYGAMQGMLSSLDDFSQFLEPNEYNELKIDAKGEFGGIGIEIYIKDGILTIVTPISGTPGEEAGLKPGDRIVKIDGVVTKGITISDAVLKMRGKSGTTVTLTVWRDKDEKTYDITMKRAMIKIRSIKKAGIIEDKVGYIKLIEFQENTAQDLDEAIKELKKDGMDSLILDLRNNPGGLLDAALDVADRFLPDGRIIVSIKSKTPQQSAVFKSTGKFNNYDIPLIVMVNEGSASASEIVAGAIQDNKRGIVLGKKTFGKASVQTVFPLKDGSAVRLTTASYLTPSGKLIRGVGIAPDVEAEKAETVAKKEEKVSVFDRLDKQDPGVKSETILAEKSDIERDSQLNRALDLIKSLRIYRINYKPA